MHYFSLFICQWVVDVDVDDNYDARYLALPARDEAERRSLDIKL